MEWERLWCTLDSNYHWKKDAARMTKHCCVWFPLEIMPRSLRARELGRIRWEVFKPVLFVAAFLQTTWALASSFHELGRKELKTKLVGYSKEKTMSLSKIGNTIFGGSCLGSPTLGSTVLYVHRNYGYVVITLVGSLFMVTWKAIEVRHYNHRISCSENGIQFC